MTVGYFVVLWVGCCQKYDCTSGSFVSETVPFVPVAARMSAISFPTTGSIVDACPYFVASAYRSTGVPPLYLNSPCSDEGLRMVRVDPFVPGVRDSS